MEHREPQNIFTALDLELNQNQETGPRIIQIGAIIGELNTGNILSKFSVFVNPKQTLEPFITQLTKIKQEDVDSGVSIEEAYHELKILHETYKAFIHPITWGQGDCKALQSELNKDTKWCFGRRELDAKTLYVSWRLANSKPPVGGLARAMKNVGLNFKGQAHSAVWDAENTFHIYRRMIEWFKDRSPDAVLRT